ncbi:MAG: hypothetical protein A3K61_02485 [Thaumarchaeota archaeon RBG_16_49_8]|nr:MAG: hypothetical protein A3K61_02485 [Thaumarchaeota archaeon RBG_16_49_8]
MIKKKGLLQKLSVRTISILVVALTIASFFLPLTSTQITEPIAGMVMERREWYLWGERVYVRPNNPQGGAGGVPLSTDVPFSPFDASSSMFAITVSAALAIPFFIIAGFYFQNLKIPRTRINIQNPFKHHIYVSLGLTLLYFALVDYMVFIYRAFGEIRIEGGLLSMIGGVILGSLLLASIMPSRRKKIMKPVIE